MVSKDCEFCYCDACAFVPEAERYHARGTVRIHKRDNTFGGGMSFKDWVKDAGNKT